MRELDDEVQVIDVEAHYDFAAAGRCGSRDHRAELKRVRYARDFSDFCLHLKAFGMSCSFVQFTILDYATIPTISLV